MVTFLCCSFPKYQCLLLGWTVVCLAGLLLCKQNGFDQAVFTWQPGTVAFAQEHCTHLKYCLNIYPHDGLLQLRKAVTTYCGNDFHFQKFGKALNGSWWHLLSLVRDKHGWIILIFFSFKWNFHYEELKSQNKRGGDFQSSLSRYAHSFLLPVVRYKSSIMEKTNKQTCNLKDTRMLF